MSPTVNARRRGYSVFVLSAWRERDSDAEDEPVWRFSLEGSQLDGRRGFGALPELVAYLEAWTSGAGLDETTSPA
ncbi:MAG: hypothetical protein MUC34_02385 [Anaerolineae bacterium]|jgi:hypothetical protein|nr:hypothetical protein [Anaerolineae bacterium]